MLPKSHRITTPVAFRRVFRTGKKAAGRFCVLYRVDDPGDRAGFVVSKKVGNAVTRNLVKRRYRALVAEMFRSGQLGGSVVVRALPAAANASWADVVHDFTRIVGRMR